MLTQVGPLTFDTFPCSLDAIDEEVSADFAKHSLLNRRQGYEAEGPGDETLTLSGEILPFHIGGLSEVSLAKQMCRAQEPQFVMRGTGEVLGWYVIMKVRLRHGGEAAIGPGGIGYVVKHEMVLERIDDPGSDAGSGLIGLVLSLF